MASAACVGSDDFTIAADRDIYLVGDELLVDDARSDLHESLYMQLFPPANGTWGPDLTSSLLLRNRFVNDLADALANDGEDFEASREGLTELAEAIARYDTRDAYRAGTEADELADGNAQRMLDSQPLGEALVLLAAIQAAAIDPAGGQVTYLRGPDGSHVIGVVDSVGAVVTVPVAAPIGWQGDVRDALVASSATVAVSGNELSIPDLLTVVASPTFAEPHTEALEGFIRMVEVRS